MKVIIEIPDEALRNAVSSQVGAALAAMSREHIEAEAKQIISTAMNRVDWAGMAERTAQNMIQRQVADVFQSVLGRPGYERNERINKLVQAAAVEAIRGSK